MGILSTVFGSGDVISKGMDLIDSLSTYVLVIVMVFLDKDVAAVKSILSEFQIDWIMLSIVMFYFGGGLADSVMKKKS